MEVRKKHLSFAIAGAIILGGILLGGLLGRQEPAKVQERKSALSAPLQILTVRNGLVSMPFEISGTVESVKKIEIYAEVSGVFRDGLKSFREGNSFRQGETLLVIEDSVYRNSVFAEKSSFLNLLTLVLPDIIIDFPEESAKWKRYTESFRIEAPLRALPEPASDRERNYLAARNVYNRFYAIRSMEATLGKYRIAAPFDGVVTLSEVNPGALIRTGQKIGEFAAAGSYELQASVGIRDAGYLKTGTAVSVVSEDFSGSVQGVIKRINSNISPSTQSVSVYIEVADPRLRDGMYLTARFPVTVRGAFSIPRRMVLDDNRVYVIEKSRFVLKQVDVLAKYDDRAVIAGLSDGVRLPVEMVPGMFDGMDAAPYLKP
ncbi:MAG: efflux RND transporter periplasmic adaptor subunit [Chlorobium sp.]|uniref:efflux RND transporter periplasmic adaptor subunit n=1 Tax=Chlorobium sp. TaxID=1095 RepID=UPI0025C13B43|nr:efflux RND transporter periplasmic adaptor subunit [Chlorobium sp.]MCF8216503.1 efflux RND transporter periplasmic adaptor subunit [Chlorobium sp.]MCF8271408.1 efflux RND transporter periplasmic adaptor subunit [Chlorobium sp.]MCF8287780.1 efflux RND transporter periplasmic adaptor subunit [Chlorobium sp.]MCF8291319.1 efflux RND transporter periplasmic adaptor subunit [Chlorobium sp.]MCF8385414.1 efflux RND transporter periplasmic adaptor subunit [Chlorobium sp.]